MAALVGYLLIDPTSTISPSVADWFKRLFTKAEKNRVGCQISCLQALSVWYSVVLHTRTKSSCSQSNFNAVYATSTNELHNIKVIGSCITHARHINSVILLWLVIMDTVFTVKLLMLINFVVHTTDFITAAPHARLNLFLTFACATCKRSNGLFRFIYSVSCICRAITSPKTTSQLLHQQRASIAGLCWKEQLCYCKSQFFVNNSGC